MDWLKHATTFDFGLCPIYGRPVQIQSYEQMDNSIKWAVKMHEWVLGKDNHWYWQPNPSGRDEEFITMCRYDSKEDAFKQYQAHLKGWVKHDLIVCGRSINPKTKH